MNQLTNPHPWTPGVGPASVANQTRRVRFLVGSVLALCAATLARGQGYATDFESPDYAGAPGGVLLTGQQGWTRPDGVDYQVCTYAGNAYGFPVNPTGGEQFIAGRALGEAAEAWAQHSNDWSASAVWTVSWDVAANFNGTLPATDYLGGFSLEPVSSATYWQTLNAWIDPNSPTRWHANYLTAENPTSGVSPGPAWANLDANHWYRQTTAFSISTGEILSVSIKDLATNSETTVTPSGWRMLNAGGPLPTDFSVLTGGTSAGNIMAWDNLRLAPAAEAFGLLHSTLGQAALGRDPNGALTVSNLGSSGEDGVSIDTGHAEGLHTKFVPVPIPVGGAMATRIIAGGPGLPPSTLGEIRVRKSAAGVNTIEGGFEGADSVTIEAYRDGQLVYRRTGVTLDSDFRWHITITIGTDTSTTSVTYDHSNPRHHRWSWSANCSPTTIHIGDDVVEGNSILLSPEFDFQQTELNRVELRGTSLGAFTITSEELAQFALPNVALGQARLMAEPDALTIANLGSTGEDGVAIDIGSAQRWDAAWMNLDPNDALPIGARLSATGTGVVNGVPGQTVGTVWAEKIGSGVAELSVDYSAIHASAYTIQVYLNDTLVAQQFGHTGTTIGTFECPDCPGPMPFDIHLICGIPIMSGCTWDTGGWLFIEGGPTVLGDRVMLIPEDADLVTGVPTVRLQGKDLGQLTLTQSSASPAWCDNFEVYPAGTQLHGLAGWQGWDGNAGAGALVSNAQAYSAPNSVAIVASSDLTHPFTGTESGRWEFRTWQYVPTDFVSHCDGSGNCGSYFLLLNIYADGGPYSWSAQLRADSVTNAFMRDGTQAASLPLVHGAWAEIKVVIDLDQDWFRVFYNGTELGSQESWTGAFPGQTTPGVLNLGALDLYASQSTVVYYDDICLNPVVSVPGDLNCDGAVNFDDINPFVQALSDPTGYQTAYPDCDLLNGDCNSDGVVNFDDINSFVALLSGS